MNRVVWFIICLVVGLELIAWGLLVPAHLRAVDARVLELASLDDRSLTTEGLVLVNTEQPGPARLLLQAAEQTQAQGQEKLAGALQRAEQARPELRVLGGPAPLLERVLEKTQILTNYQSRPILELLIPAPARQTLITSLRDSRQPGVLEILRTRELTNTVIFPPASSASGQPLEATIALTALLYQQQHLAAELRRSLDGLVSSANRGSNVLALESVYLDFLAFGKRLNWMQLVHLIRTVPDLESLGKTARLIRQEESQLPVVYAVLHLAGSPGPVVRYFERYPETGLNDLTFALRAGGGAVRKLLEEQKPVHHPKVRDKVVAYEPVRAVFTPLARLTVSQPWLGLVVKYGLCLIGALLLGRALTYLSPSLVDEIVEVRPFLTGPQVAISLCLLGLVVYFSESFVLPPAPKLDFPVQFKFPVASSALHATITHQVTSMNKFSILSLLAFFILQALIYVFCRMKLAEIRRQNVPSRLKLRLLENEEHLFDAGLYFGFVGTILSLITVSLGIIDASLMAAYSSTSFGIIFVSILKIFHVRPFRRRLILDAETTERDVQRQMQMA